MNEIHCNPRLHSHISKQLVLLALTAIMLLGSFVVAYNQRNVYAANPGPGNACAWHTVHRGETLSRIASSNHTTIWRLAQINYIRDVNLVFVGQRLCIPYRLAGGFSGSSGLSGVLYNGAVRWYDYNALQWSTRGQVAAMLHWAADRYGLPANLLLAIAWQESGWTQHVIAWDGGIGVMQVMPYTAMGINAGTGIRRDPYHLWDNINLGATLLSWLWRNFHGNLVQIISAYNEGSWAVVRRGVFNWHYVSNVLHLMRVFR
jgi:Transglycosylase SLT domain/LysM domain